eukprot:4337357-Prymnesium_polylepis.1
MSYVVHELVVCAYCMCMLDVHVHVVCARAMCMLCMCMLCMGRHLRRGRLPEAREGLLELVHLEHRLLEHADARDELVEQQRAV